MNRIVLTWRQHYADWRADARDCFHDTWVPGRWLPSPTSPLGVHASGRGVHGPYLPAAVLWAMSGWSPVPQAGHGDVSCFTSF